MFPEKLLVLQVSILFCILANAHSLHVQSLGSAGGGNVPPNTYSSNPFQAAINAHRPQQQAPVDDGRQDLEDVDSNRLSNVNRIGYSPLLMLPMRHQASSMQQQMHHRANPNAQFESPLYHHEVLGEDEEVELEEDALADLMADSSRIANHHQFGEMRVLGNIRHRAPHYGTLSTSDAKATGSQGEHHNGEGAPRHHVTIGKQVPYKHQEQLLKPMTHHVSLTGEHKATMGSNELPSGAAGENLRLLKKQQSGGLGSSSSSGSEPQPTKRLKEATSDASSSSADKGDQFLVSKKSGHPFMEDTASMIPHSIASQLMLRSARGQRQYDVPQIGECTVVAGSTLGIRARI